MPEFDTMPATAQTLLQANNPKAFGSSTWSQEDENKAQSTFLSVQWPTVPWRVGTDNTSISVWEALVTAAVFAAFYPLQQLTTTTPLKENLAGILKTITLFKENMPQELGSANPQPNEYHTARLLCLLNVFEVRVDLEQQQVDQPD